MQGNQLFWCSNCEMILTKEQAQKISCVDASSKMDNPLLSERSKDETEDNSQKNYIDTFGELFYFHNINFPEEISYMADDPLQVVFASESIENE